MRCGDSSFASAIGVSVPSKRPNKVRRGFGRALVPDVNLARVDFEVCVSHFLSPLRCGVCLRRFDLMTLHERFELVKRCLAELHKKLTRKIARTARAKIG